MVEESENKFYSIWLNLLKAEAEIFNDLGASIEVLIKSKQKEIGSCMKYVESKLTENNEVEEDKYRIKRAKEGFKKKRSSIKIWLEELKRICENSEEVSRMEGRKPPCEEGHYLFSLKSSCELKIINPETWEGEVLKLKDLMPSEPQGIELGEDIYLIGGRGYDLHTYYSSTYEISTQTGEIKKRGRMNVGRADHALGVINGLIYCAGGFNGEFLDACEVYNPKYSIWTKIANLNSPKSNLSLCPFASTSAGTGTPLCSLYAFGGFNGSSLSHIEHYILGRPGGELWKLLQIKSNTWGEVSRAGSFQLDDHTILIFGGFTVGSSSLRTYLFHATRNTIDITGALQQGDLFKSPSNSTVYAPDRLKIYAISHYSNVHIYNVNTQFWDMIKS